MKQEERTERTKQKIMHAAVKEFGTYGYEGGTIGRISRTGINKGLIYHNFKGKDDLYLACLEESCSLLLDQLKKTVTSDDLPEAARQCMQGRMDFVSLHPRHAHILFEGLLMPPASLHDEIRSVLKPLEDFNTDLLRRQLAHMTLRDGLTEDIAIRYFFVVQNAYNMSFASEKGDLSSIIRKHEEEIPVLIECMLYGIVKKESD